MAKLQTTILDLINDLRDSVLVYDDEQGDLLLIEFFFKSIPEDTIFEHAVKYVLPHREKIKNRDCEFFRKSRFLFSGLEENKVDYYLGIFSNPKRFTKDDEDVMFSYFDTMIAILETKKRK